jgi:hypothetical protein
MLRSPVAALLTLAFALVAPGRGWAAEPTFEGVAPLLKTYCGGCHGGDKPKGGLDLTNLSPDFAKNPAWLNVYERLNEGSMPPQNKPQPTEAERKKILTWLTSGLAAQQAAKVATDGRARHRRFNRIEYANTIRDLLGVAVDVETLPEDGIAHGFDKVDAGLDLSSTLLERYLETADAALDAAFVRGPKPESKKRYTEFAPTPYPEPGLATIRGATRLTVGGTYRYRISAQTANAGAPMTLLVYVGSYGGRSTYNRLVGGFDVTDKPTTIEFTATVDASESIRVFPFESVKQYGKVPPKEAGPGLVVHGVGVEGPLYDVWPPAATTRLLDGKNVANATQEDAKAILRKFAPRAFRRPVTDEELAPYFTLLKSRFDKGYTFEAALRVALKAVLCSPDFLYLAPPPGKLNDFDLAARLSYFLWSSTPDDELAELAARKELGKPDVLRQQVERMLKDPKARAFTENFTGQWLNLRHIKATTPDRHLYPDFDDLLEWSMPRETHLFFDEILKGDRSVLEFVQSDWTIINGRLATHYGIPAVAGNDFRKVSLPANSHRGGVITHASVLKVTANGTSTSPVTRGAWVLSRILGTPPPPPPKDVPAIEPDTRGAVTLRQQLAKHKEIATCAGCHARIDPPGNALENYDVIGGWRENYRISAKAGARAKVPIARGGWVWVHTGPKVDAADELPGGRSFTDIEGFKKLMLENPDQIARNLAEKLVIYGTGHKIEIADRAEIEKIVADVRDKQYGFRTLIHLIVQSDTFRDK